MTQDETVETKPKNSLMKRLLPIAAIAAIMVAFFASGAQEHATFATLQENYEELRAFVKSNFVVAAILFVVVYAIAAAASLPVASLLTLIGGFLFGWLLGTLFTVIGATTGATILFIAARTSFGEALREKVKPYLGRMEEGFHRDAFSYLLFLRLMPVFPFVVVNLVPAFLGVSTRLFIMTTFIGIIPGSAVFNFIGSGLGDILVSGEEFSLENAVNREIIIGLAGLAIVALAPIVWRKIKGRAGNATGS
ncbi:MAG: TVP38/TMEM64 family protein [Rhodospirillales bacterium]|nr:TVP38/TMEM64 family protein [Rhodospirillales bacterium]